MCEPTTLLIGSAAIGAAGTIFGGYKANQAAQAEAAQIEHQAALEQQRTQFEISQQPTTI